MPICEPLRHGISSPSVANPSAPPSRTRIVAQQITNDVVVFAFAHPAKPARRNGKSRDAPECVGLPRRREARKIFGGGVPGLKPVAAAAHERARPDERHRPEKKRNADRRHSKLHADSKHQLLVSGDAKSEHRIGGGASK